MEKLQRFFFYLLLLAFLGAYFSISLFEGLLIVAIPLGFYILWKKRENPLKGFFSFPLIGHLSVITLSSLFFLRVKEQWRRLAEQDFFSLTYFAVKALNGEQARELLKLLLYTSIGAGFILSLKVLYSYLFLHDYKGFWGGNFVVGNLLSLPFFASLYLVFTSRGNKRFIFFPLAALFLFVSFLVVERSIILGFLIGLLVFFIGSVKKLKPPKVLIVSLLGVLFLLGGLAVWKNPKVHYWVYLLKEKGISLEVLNSLSSGRFVIAEGALQLPKKAWQEGDYLKFLIGWGFGPQKQYNNLPKSLHFINEYESFILITEFINGGILNLFFVVWFYIAAILLTIKVIKSELDDSFWLSLAALSAVWVNLGYHLFTLFWVPINALFYGLLALIERIRRD